MHFHQLWIVTLAVNSNKQAEELLRREPIDCEPHIVINEAKTNFYDMTPEDIKIEGYPRALIKEKNPQMKFDLGI